MNQAIIKMLLSLIVIGVAQADVAIGSKVAALTFKDIRYVERSLDDFGSPKAYVLVFTTVGCPISQRYLPVLQKMSMEYADKGVQFVAINEGPDDTIMRIAYQAIDYGVEFPVVKDMTGACAKAVGATRTPHVIVLDAGRVIRYRGRVDDQYRITGERPAAMKSDLKDALDAVLAGKDVATPETPADGCAITFSTTASPEKPLTYAEDVAPILNKNCTVCHHAGTAAPFALMTYEEASAKANTIAEVVDDGRMPPWFAHPDFGTWANSRKLSDSDRRTLIQWVQSGKKPGDLSKAPAPPMYADSKWVMGEPDLVITADKPTEIPATGYIPYVYVQLPYQFPEDTWVQGIQIQPSNTRVVHHANVVYAIQGQDYDGDQNFLTGRVPGGQPAMLKDGVAMLIPKGAGLMVQIHYVTTGKPETDTMSVGIRYAKEVIHKQAKFKIMSVNPLTIPAGAPAHPVSIERTFDDNATLVALFTHMHLRGKNSVFTATYPDGRKETLLAIPNYSFDWQMAYLYGQDGKSLPKGTKLECKSQFDNSAFNPFNPDPTKVVEHGPQTVDEMMDAYVFYVDPAEDLKLQVDPKTGQALGAKIASADPVR